MAEFCAKQLMETHSTYEMTPMLQMSVPLPRGSKLTTSGATNSGVPNIIFKGVFGVYLLAKPKSIILMRSRRSGLKQRIFSGYKNQTENVN